MEEAKRVAEAMETAHVTQAELAAVLGITQQAVFQQLKRGLTREKADYWIDIITGIAKRRYRALEEF